MCICWINCVYLINGNANMAHITISTQLVMLCFWFFYLWADGSSASFPVGFIQYQQYLSSWPLWAFFEGFWRAPPLVCHIQLRNLLASLDKWKLVSRGTYNVWSRPCFQGSSRAPKVYTHGPKHRRNPFPSTRDHLPSVHVIKSYYPFTWVLPSGVPTTFDPDHFFGVHQGPLGFTPMEQNTAVILF